MNINIDIQINSYNIPLGIAMLEGKNKIKKNYYPIIRSIQLPYKNEKCKYIEVMR